LHIGPLAWPNFWQIKKRSLKIFLVRKESRGINLII
jgi:hypothetical protein